MAQIDDIEVAIIADASGVGAGVKSATRQLSSLSAGVNKAMKGTSLATISLGSAIGHSIAGIASKTFATLSSAMDGAVTRLDSLNNFPRVMENLGIGADKSNAAINYLSEKLQGLPTKLDSAALAVQRFTSANSNVEASTQMFLALNNAILAGGASSEIQSSAIEQLSQAYAKGKPDMMEWRTMMMAMPAQLNQVATAMGYASSSALGDALRDGSVSMNNFMATVSQLNKEGIPGFKSFEEQARGATGGVATSITNLKTAITRGLATVMDVIGQTNIAGFFNAVASAVGTATNYVAGFVKVVLTAINALRGLFGQSAIQFGKTSSSANSASDSVANIGSSANDATKGINGTTGAAKKLAKQLAGFDEMNVLREQDASGSGSGGGGGGGANLGDYNFGDFKFDTSAFDKSVDKVQEVAKKLMDSLSKVFNFDKIGKAIKRFADDVAKFLSPIGKVADDVWTKYLKPFVSWAGNDLFPAFLNAVGGAINFVGNVISEFWSAYLKPFVDTFLVPIASWTGGVVVGVLNAIGDALRGLASNQVAIDMLINSVMALLEAFAAYKIIPLVVSQFDQFYNALVMVQQGIPAAQAYIDAGAGSMAKLGASIGDATTAGAGLKMTLSGIGEMVFSPMTIAIEGVVLAMQVFEAISIACETASIRQTTAEREYISASEAAANAINQENDAINRQKELKDEITSATQGVTSAELSLVNANGALSNAQKTLDDIAAKYNMTTDEAREYVSKLDLTTGSLSEKDQQLSRAVLTVEDCMNKQQNAVGKLSEAQGALNEKVGENENMVWKQQMAIEKARMQEMLARGEYDKVAESLSALSSKSKDYKDATGETVTITKEKMGDMAGFIAEELGRVDTTQGKVWQNMYDKAKGNLDKTSEYARQQVSAMRSSGEAYANGIATGMSSNQWKIIQAARNSGLSAKNAFNAALQIHSPSRVMAKSGRYFDAGVASGIESDMADIESAASKVAELANSSFSRNIKPIASEAVDKINKTSFSVDSSISEAIEANSQTQVIVNIGDETLIDRVVNGINNSSFIKNRSAINI